MSRPEPLPASALRRRCDPAGFRFASTAELADPGGVVGQDRAVEAIRFGLEMRRDGYNVFALGPPGVGKHDVVRRFVEERASSEPVPSDWCYVHNFVEPHRPRALRLPPGRAQPLKRDMQRLLDELRVAIPAAFEGEEYRNRKKLLEEQLKEAQERALGEIESRAREGRIALLRSPMGLALAPVRDGEVLDPAEFHRLPDKEQERYREDMARLQTDLQAALAAVPRMEKEHRDKVRALDREVTSFAVGHLIDELRSRYVDLPEVLAHLDAVQHDVIENADEFVDSSANAPLLPLLARRSSGEARVSRRYLVNVLVDNGGAQGSAVVFDDQPSHASLVGRIEHVSELGSLVTDFNFIKGGSLHRANGGYLILDARKVLVQPFAWEELKRAIRSKRIRVESLGQLLSLGTVMLEPEPVPLEVKVVLLGDRLLYYLLAEHDPDFLDLFKVAADFDERIERDAAGEEVYARLLGSMVRKEGLRPLDKGAVAAMVEHGSRLLGDAERLSTDMVALADVLREADHRAGTAGRPVMTADDVRGATAAQLRRAGRFRERTLEEIRRGTHLIDTGGAVVGQVNGLSVVQLGQFAFGHPTRITARARLGGGQVVDIEREVELGGPIHSKGVLILAGFLGGRYAADRPLSLSASLVFEQSYGGVEGDSASSAELYALLSALAEAPVRQWLGVTGSVNQHGQVQAVGGVNEKIEAFFDVCSARGLTGTEGVLVPAANVKHLALREDVVAAAAEGRFHVYPVETVDQGIELLTGIEAGERDEMGVFPPGSLNARVEARLAAFAERARQFGSPGRGEPGP